MMRAESTLQGEILDLPSAARCYAENGVAILPVDRDKKPVTRLVPHGVLDASSDPAVVAEWWRKYPRANIGIACGLNGIVVVDVDVRDHGLETWAALDPGVETMTVKTGSGGNHYYYRAPASPSDGRGLTLRNSTSKIGPGVDVKTGNAYVIAPPSIHKAGPSYAWVRRQPLAELPGVLLERMQELPSRAGQLPVTSSRYASAALEGELTGLRAAQQGTRNTTLYLAAFKLGTLVGAGALDEGEVCAALAQAARDIGLGEHEADRTIVSGMQAGRQRPRMMTDDRRRMTDDGRKMSNDEQATNDSSAVLGSSSAGLLLSSDPVPLGVLLETLPRGDMGDAMLLAGMRADRLVYDHAEKRWYLWNAHHWTPDCKGEVVLHVGNDLATQYYAAAAEEQYRNPGGATVKALSERANALGSRRKIDNVLALARCQPGLSLRGDEWDCDPMRLGVMNGTLELRTGELRAGAPGDYIRTVAPVEWQGSEAPAPRWDQFLLQVMAGDIALIAYLQRFLGYSLTGLTSDHALPIFWGEGRNGKDTLFETLASVLGPYAAPASADLLLDSHRDSNAATPDLYALRGRRLIWVSETNAEERLNGARIKQLTGGGTIVARPLFGAPVTFSPTFKLILVTNHKPRVEADDYALWKRIQLCPFTQAFVDEPQLAHEHPRDPHLLETLKEERPGILAWLVRGCLEWQACGLQPPAPVQAATEEYRREEDRVGEFIAACCVLNPTVEVRSGELYAAYRAWAERNGQVPMSSVPFGRKMAKRFQQRKSRDRIYTGVGLMQ